MTATILSIRFNQIIRSTWGIGLFRLIILVCILMIAPTAIFIQTVARENATLTASLVLLIITAIHLKRPDKSFLKTNFTNYKNICATEYLFFTAPLTISLMIHQQWIVLLSTIALTFIISQLNITLKVTTTLNTPIQALIPDTCFEWKAGVRKTLFFIVPLWLLGMATSFVIFSVPITLLILGFITSTFYEESEPMPMIVALQMGSKQFIHHKLKQGNSLFSALALPLIIAFIIFNPQYWYIPAILYLIFITIITYIILLKYAHYQALTPARQMNAWGLLPTLLAIPLLTPFMLPIVWILSIRFYFKSIKTLNPILNDFN